MLHQAEHQQAFEKRFTVRPPTATLEDAAHAANMFNAAQVIYTGRNESTAEDVLIEWQMPDINLEQQVRLVFADNGQCVGYAESLSMTPHVQFWSWGRVHPDYRGQGIGSYLLQFSEATARAKLHEAPADAKVFMRTGTIAQDEPGQQLLRENGFEQVRSFYRMVIDLDQPQPAPQVPEGLVIRTAIKGDEDRAVILATREAFRDHFGFVETPFEEVLADYKHFMNNDPHHDHSLWFVAMDGDEVAGTSLCYPHMEGYPGMGWINQLAVRRPWRKRGLARALLLHSFAEFKARGFTQVGLGVDAVNPTGALRLYESAGMHVARTYNTYDKTLREGVDLSLRELHD